MRGGHKGLAPPLRWRGSLLACLRIVRLCWSLRITRRGSFKPLQISCCSCCESLWILADRSGSFSICFSEFSDSCWSSQINLQRCGGLSPHAPSPSVSNLVVSMGGQVSIFPPIWFSVTVPVGSCLQGWFPLTGLPWIPPCLGVSALVNNRKRFMNLKSCKHFTGMIQGRNAFTLRSNKFVWFLF